MKTRISSSMFFLAPLLGGCLDLTEQTITEENATLTSNAPVFDDTTSRLKFAAVTAAIYNYDGDGDGFPEDHHTMQIGLSSSPFLCGLEGAGDYENYFDIQLESATPIVEGAVLPLRSVSAVLTNINDNKYLYAFAVAEEPAASDLEASVEVFSAPGELAGFSGRVTARLVSPDLQAIVVGASGPDDITFTVDITGAPLCDFISLY